MQLVVTGVGSATPMVVTTTQVMNGTVGTVRLGFISTIAGNPAGVTLFDEFESTRGPTPIGRLCRGDADDSGMIGPADYTLVSDEILRRTIAPGQPDCNEDAQVDALDRVCIAKLTTGTCP